MTATAEAMPAAKKSANRPPDPVWDRVWRNHPSNTKDDALLARELRSPRWALVVDRVESTFGSIRGLKTIELGCGRGDLSVLLAQRGASVTLLDQNELALAEAKRRFDRLGLRARYERGDIFGPRDSLSGRFDVACSLGVVEHFKGRDRTRAIAVHHRMLASGGLAVVSVPHAGCLPYRFWKSYLELRGWWPYGMEIPYSRREIALRAREAGFSRIDTQCVGFWQSIGDHWGKSILGRGPDWVDRRSRMDATMGLVLLLFGWKAGPLGHTATSMLDAAALGRDPR